MKLHVYDEPEAVLFMTVDLVILGLLALISRAAAGDPWVARSIRAAGGQDSGGSVSAAGLQAVHVAAVRHVHRDAGARLRR